MKVCWTVQFISHLNPLNFQTTTVNLASQLLSFLINMIHNPPFPTHFSLHHKTLVRPLNLTFAQDRLFLYIITLRSIVSDTAFALLSTGYAE